MIYLVEDDEILQRETTILLQLNNFEVIVCSDFVLAATDILNKQPDCVLLDLTLPGVHGHEICRDIKSHSNIPVIILTSSDREYDEIMGLNLGADDYITKPYSPAVLIARIQAVLRRCSHISSVIEYRGVMVDISKSLITYKNSSLEISKNELKILVELLQHKGCIVSRQDLMFALWQSDEFINDNTLTVNVNRLRKSLSSIGVPDDFLKTYRGQGYMV